MNRMLCVALATVFVIFLVFGTVFNCQQGLYDENNTFWQLKRSGRYQHGRDWVLPLPDGSFELHLADQDITATQASLPDGGVRVSYSDGWAVERLVEDDYFYHFGGYAWGSDASLILTDMEKAGLQFAAADHEERFPFYDGTGERIIGETIEILSADGQILDHREIWFESPQHSTPERETIILQNGTVLGSNPGYYDSIFQNAEGEYLLEDYNLGRLPVTGHSLDRVSFTFFLLQAANGETEARGELLPVFAYILLLALGAAQLLCPKRWHLPVHAGSSGRNPIFPMPALPQYTSAVQLRC